MKRVLGWLFGRSFANEAAVEAAHPPFFSNENYSDEWVMLAPYGRWPNPQGMQVFEQADAQAMVRDFQHPTSIGVKAIGIPFYIGHPDHPAFKDRYTDTRAYGRVKQLEARPEGLFGNVKWNEEGKKLIQSEAFHGHSVNWRMRPEGSSWRPTSLKSVGFTNEPNLPVAPITHANETQMKSLAKLLGLPETATEAEIESKLQTVANERQQFETDLQTARQTITTLQAVQTEYEGKKTEFANAQQKVTALEGEKTQLAGQVQTLTTERDQAQTNFANERKARTKDVLNLAIREGRITEAERPTWETNFANESAFDQNLQLITARQSGLPTGSSRVNGGNRVADNQDRLQKVQDFCNEQMKSGLSYDEAFAKCKRDKAEWFKQMQQPAHVQA